MALLSVLLPKIRAAKVCLDVGMQRSPLVPSVNPCDEESAGVFCLPLLAIIYRSDAEIIESGFYIIRIEQPSTFELSEIAFQSRREL